MINTQLLYAYSRMDSRVAPLVTAFKHWADVRGIKNAQGGFFASYALTLMMIFFLQKVKVVPVLHNLVPEFRSGDGFGGQELYLPRWRSSNSQNLGSLFRDMLKFYSEFE